MVLPLAAVAKRGVLATRTVTPESNRGFVSAGVLRFLLVQFGETAAGVAAFIAILLLSPLMLFAAALLYFDQAARLSPGPRREGLTTPRARRAK